MDELGDIAAVWSIPAFVLAGIFGFGFGYLVLARIYSQPRWRTENSARTYAWLIGVLAAWWGMGFFFVQVLAALIEGDWNWPRILSRLGPYLVASVGIGFGVYFGHKRSR